METDKQTVNISNNVDMVSHETMGDRIKSYEYTTTKEKFDNRLPLVVRLDGKSFSTFTKKFEKPFDKRMVRCMQEATKFLVKSTNAKIGYTQSDEITLIYYLDNQETGQFMFDGKSHKLHSVLASMASVYFFKEYITEFNIVVPPAIPVFDCRVFNVPNKLEAVNCLLWRENDAYRNAVSMAAQSKFSAKQLHRVSTEKKKKMLLEQCDIDFDTYYPDYFRFGSYVKTRKFEKTLTEDEISKIPTNKIPLNGKVIRSDQYVIKMKNGSLMSYKNKISKVFD